MLSFRPFPALSTVLALVSLAACSDSGDDGDSTGGASVGGANSGGSGTGGSSSASGGATSGGNTATGGTAPGSGGSTATGGATASGGSPAGKGGAAGGGGNPAGGAAGAAGATGGGAGSAGMGGTGAAGSAGMGGASGSGGGPPATRFSFFVTSLEGMTRVAKSEKGFGGDLRYGEADGLAGADKICRELAEKALPGAGQKVWRAFLSAASGPGGQPVNAISRIGEGPWYDRVGRVLAMTKADLLNARPRGADPAIINDLPNEYGVPNHRPDPAQPAVDNHHFLTGSNEKGELYGATSTCNSWTSLSAGRPRIGFSWPVSNRQHWISGQDEGGCGAGIMLTDAGGSDPSNPVVGSGGGYGGIYCFALTP